MTPRSCSPALLALVALASAPIAQTSSRPNVIVGAIAQFDASSRTVTIRSRTGRETSFRIEDKTLVLRLKREGRIEDFKPSETVYARFRKSAQPPAPLYDLADEASWKWLERVRKETTAVKVTAAEEDWLRASEGSDDTPISYRTTARTAWAKDGKEAGADAFQPGERAFVAPRLLPNGAIMATGVADTAAMANILKERSRPTVTGTVVALNLPERSMRLKTKAGDDRRLTLAATVLVTREGKSVGEGALRTGLTVTAHVRRTGEGDAREVVRVTIQTDRGASGRTRSNLRSTSKPKPT